MKKLIFLMIGVLLIGSMFVNASINEPDIKAITETSRVSSIPLEPKDFNFLDWLSNLFGTGRAGFETELDQSTCNARLPPYRNTVEKFGDKDNKNVEYGGSCNKGEYIRLVACDKSGTICDQVFDDFYKVEYSSDRLKISKECDKLADGSTDGITDCNDRAWFRNKVYDKYVGYDCMVCEEEEEPMDAKIISYNIPDESIYGDTITVTANIKFLADGKYYVESGLDEPSQTFSVVDMSRALSQCDASPQYDGRWVYVGDGYGLQAGDTEQYTFRFKDYGLVADYRVDLVVTNGCYWANPPTNTIKNPDYEPFDIKSEWISIVSGLQPTVECDCNICDANDKCVEKRYTGNDCPCNVECTSDAECVNGNGDDGDDNGDDNGGTPSDSDAPVIYDITLLPRTTIRNIDDGETLPFSVTIKTPLGFNSERYPGRLYPNKVGIKQLKLEVGVYDKDWAEKQGWIQTLSWWERAWMISTDIEPCRESEASFVKTYKFYTPGIKSMEWCERNSKNFDEDLEACIQVFTVDNDGNQLVAKMPERGSTFWNGEDNYNKDGEYLMVMGLYYYCSYEGGGYLPNKASSYKRNLSIGELPDEDELCIKKGEEKIETCNDGSEIVAIICKEQNDGTLRWKKTGNECPEEEEKPSGEIKQLSLTKSEWKDATHPMIIKAQCDFPYQCIKLEGYEVNCEYSPEIEARNKDAYGKETAVFTRFKNSFMNLFVDKDTYLSGTCRATKISDFGYCKYTEPLAFFEITGDECQDGLIIIIGGIFLLLLIPKLLGGGK